MGAIEQVAFEIDTYVVSTGKTSVTYTRLKARAIDPIPSDIRVSTAHLFSDLGRLMGLQDVATGDAVFDEKYVVKADHDDDARALLDASTRKSLLDFPHSVRFEYRAGEGVGAGWRRELDRNAAAGPRAAAARRPPRTRPVSASTAARARPRPAPSAPTAREPRASGGVGVVGHHVAPLR